MHEKKPLYRSDNTTARGARQQRRGGEYRWSRSTKKTKQDDSAHGSMHGERQHGRDYTPLFKFLLSRIGGDWAQIHSEAVSRLDRADPIFWMVARSDAEKKPVVRIGDNTHYSGLYVDESNRLAMVDPNLRVEDMEPSCDCCTHTFNGVPFVKPYRPR